MYLRADLHHTPARSSMELGSGLHCQMLPWATELAIRASCENPKDHKGPSFDPYLPHLNLPCPPFVAGIQSFGSSSAPLAGAAKPSGAPCFHRLAA